VGTGFHPELTGRENIVLSGAILGMKQSEVLSKFDEIVAFADVEKFIDTPVKHYSSGMALRLGFAVAAHFEPEILMVDEVLAVGDIQFQKKCMGRLGQVARSGRTVLLVSHNLAAIAALCTRAVVISEGSVSFEGDVRTAVKQYLSENATMNRVSLEERSDREGDGRLRFDMVELIGESGKSTDTVQSGERVSFSLGYTSSDKNAIENTLFEIKVSDEVGSLLFALSTILTGENFNRLQPSGKVECRVPSLPLTPGKYSVQIVAYVNNSLADWVRDATSFTVVEGNFFGTGRELRSDWYGQFLVPHNWISQS
jgi:lipopolysaccharide transport system ATP-binding protein